MISPEPLIRTGRNWTIWAGPIISLLILLIVGRVGAHQLAAALWLMPAVLVGTALSRCVHGRINGPALRLAVLVFSIVSGAALILKG